ncbi:unnamed protein product [Protopolystoma xenopodis]|uniref:Uncharacterized protein n=1 Tax=Protopolystoma xenopodis TaxID=117903 RepID=A0A3S4ZS42_9PLAT|nr:unnamed protein product [Protopolystoma xenopodis]
MSVTRLPEPRVAVGPDTGAPTTRAGLTELSKPCDLPRFVARPRAIDIDRQWYFLAIDPVLGMSETPAGLTDRAGQDRLTKSLFRASEMAKGAHQEVWPVDGRMHM